MCANGTQDWARKEIGAATGARLEEHAHHVIRIGLHDAETSGSIHRAPSPELCPQEILAVTRDAANELLGALAL